MSKTLTREDLNAIGQLVDKKLRPLEKKIDGVESGLGESIRGLNSGVNQRFTDQAKRLVEMSGQLKELHDRLLVVETKVDTIMEELATRRELRNLVAELKKHGVPIQANKVFVS